MRFALLFAALLVCLCPGAETPSPVSALAEWLAQPRASRGEPGAWAGTALSKAGAAGAMDALWKDHAAHLREERAAEHRERVVRAGGMAMKYEAVSFGAKDAAPAGGRSLFISMHGGGNAPPSLNDGQWRNQVTLARAYRPSEGLYVAPRAPTDTWNLWHEPHMDALLARLIGTFIVMEGVNPDRVYLLGYSAGGDGVYQLAPRMGDRLAAAAMMAGHPNETKPDGLRNVPFAIQVGEKDDGYKRNEVAQKFGRQLDELRAADPAGYEHFTELHAGKGHWMDTADRKAVPWMEKFTRNPFPERIVWRQDDVLHTRSYWLAVEKADAKAGALVTATRAGQEITLASGDVGRITVLLNDAMLDLDRPVVIRSGGRVLHEGIVQRTIGTIRSTLLEYGDPRLIFSARVTVDGVTR